MVIFSKQKINPYISYIHNGGGGGGGGAYTREGRGCRWLVSDNNGLSLFSHFKKKYCEVCGLLCINDEEKSGVVLGYFLCISQLCSQKAKRPFFPLVYSMPSCTRLSLQKPPALLTGKLSFNPIG